MCARVNQSVSRRPGETYMAALLRSQLLRQATFAALLSPLVPLRSAAIAPAIATVTRRNPTSVVLPLLRCGGAYCTEYWVDGSRFRAVADTGSPFLLVLASQSCPGGPERWGCFENRQLGQELDRSEEGFGGQDMGVIWRRGAVRLSSIDGGGSRRQSDEATRALADRREGARAGPWTRPSERDDLLYEPVNFGVVTSVSQTGGASAMYLGLAKERNPRAAVRPTFLEQTDVEALAFDFGQRTLTLSRNPLVRGDAIPLLDLRPLGAPVAQYTAAVHKLGMALAARARAPCCAMRACASDIPATASRCCSRQRGGARTDPPMRGRDRHRHLWARRERFALR